MWRRSRLLMYSKQNSFGDVFHSIHAESLSLTTATSAHSFLRLQMIRHDMKRNFPKGISRARRIQLCCQFSVHCWLIEQFMERIKINWKTAAQSPLSRIIINDFYIEMRLKKFVLLFLSPSLHLSRRNQKQAAAEWETLFASFQFSGCDIQFIWNVFETFNGVWRRSWLDFLGNKSAEQNEFSIYECFESSGMPKMDSLWRMTGSIEKPCDGLWSVRTPRRLRRNPRRTCHVNHVGGCCDIARQLLVVWGCVISFYPFKSSNLFAILRDYSTVNSLFIEL